MSNLKAVILGAIGVVAETSDLQRQAFNAAFSEAGLGWSWDQETYRALLSINGGQARLRSYRASLNNGTAVSDAMIASLHQRKTELYAERIAGGSLSPRTGVVELIAACQQAGIPTALCTSTSRDNVDAIATGLGATLNFDAFATIVTIDRIAHAKPAPDAYFHCLKMLGLTAHEVIAIEDTPVSMASAISAGISVIATPGAMTKDQDFSGAALVVQDLALLTLADIETLHKGRQSSD